MTQRPNQEPTTLPAYAVTQQQSQPKPSLARGSTPSHASRSHTTRSRLRLSVGRPRPPQYFVVKPPRFPFPTGPPTAAVASPPTNNPRSSTRTGVPSAASSDQERAAEERSQAMEKAVDRQRVLLRHLNPAAASSPAPPAISVRIPSFTLALSGSLGPNRACWSDRFGGGICGPRSGTERRGCCVCVWVRGRQARARRGTARRTTGGRPSPTTSSSSRK